MVFIKRLVWDGWNVAHIARHGVTPDEVEQMARGDVLVQIGKKGRTALIGPTNSGRMLRVIFDPEEKDRYLYKQEKEGDKI